ncbi:hypothetical protein CTAYLR_002729 [Chrysophaeum taylorii]|uniref:NUC153 domain-containing protein n=1 Tax=Chrysophaeum taylorii TaxID=2483200 RepID=A0AAD7UCY1_9STRA|nr:hypothetical protein CTAYLR_002729 [Chrysophaeum taylorii]
MAVRVGSDVPVYCLSEGAQVPAFVSERKRRQMQKEDEMLRRRIELLQDLEFESGTSKCAKFSEDGRFLVVAGEYPPRCKVFELGQLGMKFERRVGCECVDVAPLSEDLGKLVALLADRTLDVHAPYGSHYKVRVASHGRELAYDAASCVLHVAGAKGDAERLDLDAGKFLSPLEAGAPLARIKVASGVPLIAAGGEDGVVRLWDARGGKAPVASLDARTDDAADEVSALAWEPTSGLALAVGTTGARVGVYDLRMRNPIQTKEHQYELPIVDVHFLRGGFGGRRGGGGLVLSADERLVKAWNLETGETAVNVETTSKLSRFEIAPVATASDAADSGLLVCPGEQPRVMTYYVPALGPAPRWCAFLDSLTEEMEETEATAFDDFRFVSAKEVEDLGASHLVGTPTLRAYMHGYFVDAKVYRKLKAVAEPFAYDEWRKEQKLKKQQRDNKRISSVLPVQAEEHNDIPPVNADLAARLRPDADPLLEDDRFAAMFTDRNFEIDTDAPEYIARHPNSRRRANDVDDQRSRFLAPPPEDDDDDDDEQRSPAPKPPSRTLAAPLGIDAADALGLANTDDVEEKTTRAAQPLNKRISRQRDDDKSRRETTTSVPGEGTIKEFTYYPDDLPSKKPKTKIPNADAATTHTSSSLLKARVKHLRGRRRKKR